MTAQPEVIEVVRRWVRKAEHDLEATRRILRETEACPYDTACFHCQQAAEKYLKALLTLFGVQAPRTHNLEALFALLPAEATLPIGVEELAGLNPYAVEMPYAEDWREPERSEADRALSVAKAIREQARSLLPPETLS